MIKEVTTEYHDYFFVEVKGLSKRSRYAFILEDKDEMIVFGERRILNLDKGLDDPYLSDLGNFYCFPYLNEIDVLKSPTWVKNTVWYQIFPDRFANGDKENDPEGTYKWGTEPDHWGYLGGDIQGIIDHMDYLVDLGITGIHFCPLFKGDKNHKYETTDYMRIDPAFGSNELFKQFVQIAHSNGIKVMLDGVFNHVGINHPFFQDVVTNGEDSQYKDWFSIKSFPIRRGSYETFATVDDMPRVNLECKEAIDYFVEVGRYWIEEFNIDGWRLDVANEVTHDFWKKFREVIKATNPDVYILGEVWHDANPWIQGDQYDAVMHYPLTDACIRYFAKGVMDTETFIETTNRLLVHYQRNAIENSYNILDSHDTSRFLYEAGGDVRKLLLAYAFIFTHPGCPSIYYGDEIGLDGEKGMGKELHRRCMVWDQKKWNHLVHDRIKLLIHIRKQNNGSMEIPIKWLDVDVKGVLAYTRGNLLVVMNTTKKAHSIALPKSHRHYDLLTEDGYLTDNGVYVEAMDYLIASTPSVASTLEQSAS